jgi:hypothetical protein
MVLLLILLLMLDYNSTFDKMDLKNVSGIKSEEIELLSKNWITTSEEFTSICLNKNLSKNLQRLLKVNDNRFQVMVKLILNSLSDDKINEIKQFKNFQNKTGAKRPIN